MAYVNRLQNERKVCTILYKSINNFLLANLLQTLKEKEEEISPYHKDILPPVVQDIQ